MTTDRISAATTFTYTPLGQLASLTDAENQTTSYTYDARGLKLTETYPDHTGGSTVGQTGYGIVTFVYDNAGRVLRKQDQLGVTLTHSYDLAGRMTRRDYRTAANSPSGTIADSDTFTFDRASRMLTAVNGRYTNTVTYTYDPVGRKATEALTISNVTYTIGQAYNARNELTTITYPNNTTSTRSYHPTGTLNQLGLDGSTVSTRSYDAGRRQTTEVLSNGITETRTYRNDNLLSAINYSNTSLGNMTYTWDANKNKTSESITGVMSGYGFTAAGTTYDFEDRLTGFSRAATSGPALLSQSWNLTTVGDWTSVTTNGTAQNRTHGPTHELLTAGGQNVATDVKGNITTLPANLRPAGATTALNLTWDSDNKLRSADIDANGTADVNFQYDALGRRVARTGTGGSVVFVQMDQQTIADYPVGGAATTPTFRYVYASYIDEPVVRKGPTSTSTVHFYHRNHQYSVTAITTSTGAIAERYAYTAYGQPTILNASGTPLSPQTSTLNSRYSYTGREWDATLGLHHFRARWMSPSAGRFLGRDPIGYEDGKSLYRLKIGLSLMDSTGRYIHDAFGKWCCEGDASTSCCVTIKVRRPCRTVAVQIADNLAHGFPPDHGVTSGHAWIEGSCRNSWFRVGLWQDPNNPGQGIVNDEGPLEQQFGVSHKKSFCGLCHASFECMYSSLFAADNNPPLYCLIDPTANGCANCASFVTDHLKGCGMQIPHASDPWQLTNGAEQVGPCYPDGAGKP